MGKDLQWWCNKSIQKQGIEVTAFVKHPNGQTSIMLPWEMKTLSLEESQDGTVSPVPFPVLTQDSAQRLLDELWSCGIRPSTGEGHGGELAAVRAHLKDMQAITFSLMDLKK